MLTRLMPAILREEQNDDKSGGSGGKDGGEDNKGAAVSAKLAADLEKSNSELAQLKADIDKERKAKLAEANDFKSLYEQEKNAKSELETRLSKLKENIVHNEKFKAAQTELVKRGMKPEALKILDSQDLKDLVVETTSEGRFLVHGADTFADKFKKDYSFAFEAPKPGKVNGGGGNGAGGESDSVVSATDLFMLEKAKGTKSPEYQAAKKKFMDAKFKRN